MTTTRYFVESDYDLTLQLQELFNETVELQAKLDHSEVENTRLKEERRELTLKLKKAHNEISLLVKKMKFLISDAEVVNNLAPLTMNTSRRIH